MSPTLHLGQRCWTGNTVAPQLSQVLPMSCGLSSGQVEISGASAFCMRRSSVVAVAVGTNCKAYSICCDSPLPRIDEVTQAFSRVDRRTCGTDSVGERAIRGR